MGRGGSSPGRYVRHVRWTLRSRAAERSWYLRFARRKYGHMMVCDSSEMLIDGFTRSACVYAAVAFQLAQPRPVRLAHLIHSPAHIIDGVKRGVPTLVTIREPEDAVMSCLVREPHTSAPQVLDAYERFYGGLLRHRAGFVVGDFRRVTSEFHVVVREVNERFGTHFVEPEATGRFPEQVFAFIDERARRPPWEAHIGYVMSGLETPDDLAAARGRSAGRVAPARGAPSPFEDRVARPSAHKDARKAAMRDRYLVADLDGRRRRATEIYRTFVER
jgi:hypothetical protein